MRSVRGIYKTAVGLLVVSIAVNVLQTAAFLWYATAIERDMRQRREAAQTAEELFNEARKLMENTNGV